MTKHKCAYCGKEYETDTYYSKYCSVDCSKAAEEQRKQEYAKTKVKVCPCCNRVFQLERRANGNYSNTKYCSSCSNIGGSDKIRIDNNTFKILNKKCNYYFDLETKTYFNYCKHCGKKFYLQRRGKENNYNFEKQFCSDECQFTKYKKDYEKVKTRICKFCGKEFNVPRITDGHFSETLFCSDTCRFAGRSKAQNLAQSQREQTCIKKYGVIYPCLTKQCRDANFNINSNVNKDFAELLKEHNIEFEEEFIIESFAYDFKVNNILIEINPTYTHSVLGNHFDTRAYRSEYEDYHKRKTELARKNNYNCINIWDWDNWGSIILTLQPKQKLYARNLTVDCIDKQDANTFLLKYHIQGKCKGNSVNLGLYKDNELIQVMTFGKPRYNKNYQYELLRLCTKSDYMVVGGAERLFKHFIDSYNPESILSYCDMSKFTGDVYTRLGFKLKAENRPQKVWSKGNIKITDNLLRQRGFDQLFKTNYGKGTNNEELMIQEGWRPVYDCGQNTYVWSRF